MSKDVHRAATADLALDSATTNVRHIDTEHRLERFVTWLEQIASSLARSGLSTHLMNCEQLIAELRRTIRSETPEPLLGPEIRQCMGGMRSILRAVRAGQLHLDPDLRREMVELVAEITESILEHDLSRAP